MPVYDLAIVVTCPELDKVTSPLAGMSCVLNDMMAKRNGEGGMIMSKLAIDDCYLALLDKSNLQSLSFPGGCSLFYLALQTATKQYSNSSR